MPAELSSKTGKINENFLICLDVISLLLSLSYFLIVIFLSYHSV